MFLDASLLFALAVAAIPLRSLPTLGDVAPASLRAHAAGRTCDVGEGHKDPCVLVSVRRERVTVAWDTQTHAVSYLYSTTLHTDSRLVVGGLGRIDASMDIQPFQNGFVSPDWCDTDTALSGDALWCALMKPAPRHNGRVLGFVQSVYLLVPDVDTPVVIRIARPRRH